jgi:hypothetical protein
VDHVAVAPALSVRRVALPLVVPAGVAGLTAAVLYWFTGPSGSGYDFFVPLADAFLHGRLHLVDDRPWMELIHWGNGIHYVPVPPVPALTLLPVVAAMGPQPWHAELSPNAAGAAVGGLNVALVYTLLRRQGVRQWALALLVLGFATTTHWWVAGMGGPHHYAQLVAVTFLLTALMLALEGRWPFAVGILVGLAAGSRLPAGLALPFLYALYGVRPNRRHIGLLAGVAIPAAAIAWYNFARFGDPLQFGYALIASGDAGGLVTDEGWYTDGLLSLTYIPRSLDLAFLGWWQEGWYGESITLTAPFLLLAVHARHQLAPAAWVAIAAVMLPNVAHGNPGVAQYGYRFILDAVPLLLVLLAWRYREGGADWWLGATVVFGAIAGAVGFVQAAAT